MQTRSVETRKKILSTAEQLFSRSGYESASVADICSAAGISKGAFYHHFPSKQAVFMELLSEWLKGIDQGLEMLRANQEDPAEALLQMTDIFSPILEAAKNGMPIFLEFWAHAVRDPALWKEAIAPFRRYQEYFTLMLSKMPTIGGEQPPDARTAASAVLAVAIGIIIQGMMDTEGQDWSRVGRESMQYLLEGLTRRSA
jgi:AcrR family transcriptional regulator